MDFGRINNSEAVDYLLPNDHSSIPKILGGTRHAGPKIYVGGVLWASDSFVGTIYPRKALARDFVKYYTHQFNTIELNATHYKIPDVETIQRWRDQSPGHFNFCPKINKDISHSVDLRNQLSLHNCSAELFKLLGPKLGTCLLQLPPQFSPQRLAELSNFLGRSQLNDLALELRHPDWFKRDEELNRVCNQLFKNNSSIILTDTPGRRDVLHMRLTNKTTMIRFNANNHPTDKSRIDAWIARLNTWLELGLERVYFFIHTPQQLHMPHLVTYFIQQLDVVCGIKLPAPLMGEDAQTKEGLFVRE